VFLLGPMMAGSAAIGQALPPMPARKNAWGIYDVFTANDGAQVFIGLTSDQHWHRFCAAFGFADLKDDPRLQGNANRCEERGWMLPDMQARLAGLDVAHILATCEAASVPYARVGRPDQLAADPHLASGGLIDVALDAMGGGSGNATGLPALPLEFGDARERPGLDSQPPAIGEHTRAVLAAAGWSAAGIDGLIASGVVAAR
jgi:crotonobetainyl-CoA:carnitine CoA-transferase CaiB-like acyl-CoA transferase